MQSGCSVPSQTRTIWEMLFTLQCVIVTSTVSRWCFVPMTKAAGCLQTRWNVPRHRCCLLSWRDVEVEDARVGSQRGDFDNPCGPTVPFPTVFEDYDGAVEAMRKVEIHLNYPPYPWLDEAKLGMEMGRYFDAVELTDWVNPHLNKRANEDIWLSKITVVLCSECHCQHVGIEVYW